MADSIDRITRIPQEAWAAKLADRIINLQAPPFHRDQSKISRYKQDG